MEHTLNKLLPSLFEDTIDFSQKSGRYWVPMEQPLNSLLFVILFVMY